MVGTITRRQILMLGLALALDAAVVSLPNQMINLAKMDAWLSYIAAMFVILVGLWFLSRSAARFPGKDLFEALVLRFPIVGRLLSLLIIVFLFYIVVRDVRVLTEFVSITLLPNTPLVMISMLIVLCIVFISRRGPAVIGRMTELWVPLLILFLLSIPFFLFPEFESHYAFPMFYEGLGPPLLGTWYALGYIGELAILPFLFASGRYRFREGFLSLALGTILLVLVHFYLILAMGVHVAGKMLFPLYETVRLIRVTDFLDRFDLPLLLVYLPVVITKASFIMYAVMHGLKRVVPVLSMKELVFPFGVWVFVCSFWFFENSVQLFNMNRVWPVYVIFCTVLIPGLLFIMLRVKTEPSTHS